MRHLGIRYWVLGIVVVALLAVGCEPTETPTPTLSPLPTPTAVSPLPTPTPEQQEAGEFWLDYEQTVVVYHTGVTTPTLFWAVKLLDESGGVVYSETLDTGVEGPVVTGTGKFDGSFFFDYPLFDGTAAEWAKCWWGSEEMYVIDPGEVLRLVDRIDCEFAGTQDGEGYWFIKEITGLEHRAYLPVAMRARGS